jgi:hypothetical protein
MLDGMIPISRNVRTKCKCIYSQESEFGKLVEMSVIRDLQGNDDFNNDISSKSASGTISLIIDKGTKAFDFFIPGIEYYLDFNETST